METTVAKLKSTGWTARTDIDLGEVLISKYSTSEPEKARRILRVETYRHNYGQRTVQTNAACHILHDDGIMTHAFGLGRMGSGDFSMTVMHGPERGTEKAVREQHAAVLKDYIGAVVEQAKAFYDDQEISKRNREMVPA